MVLVRQLEYLVALAKERHFARAARACFVSQPALSESVRKLEQELGLPLIRRGRRFPPATRPEATHPPTPPSAPRGTAPRRGPG